MHLNASELLKNRILKVLFVMPKINPIFTFSKINLKLTKKSSRFIFSNYFIKKLLEFYIVSSILQKKPGNPGYIFTFQRFVCRCIRHKSTSCEQVYIHHNLDNESTLVSPICNVFYVLLYVFLNFFSVELPCLHLLVIIQFEII